MARKSQAARLAESQKMFKSLERERERERESYAAAEEAKRAKKRKEIERAEEKKDKKQKPSAHEHFADPDVFLACFQQLGKEMWAEYIFSADIADVFHTFLCRVVKAVLAKLGEGNSSTDLAEAVKTVLPGQLGINAAIEMDRIMQKQYHEPHYENVRNLATQMAERLPLAKEEVIHQKLAILVEFSLGEFVEKLGRVHKEQKVGSGLSCVIVHHDLDLVKQALASGEHKFEDPADEEKTKKQVKELLQQRYAPVPFLYAHEIIMDEDDEWAKVATNLFTKAEIDALLPRELKSRSEHDKVVLGVTAYSMVSNGVGSKPHPRSTTFPTQHDLSLLWYFCLKYDPVDSQGWRRFERDEGWYCDVHEELLTEVREKDGGADFEAELSQDDSVFGCSSLQLFGALLFQRAAGKVGSVSFSVADTDDEDPREEW
eukprot:CAMPEP_0175146348 /NCGR_PEP_ID=MMETSP0087-20121206/15333_1 /TAXON_ID=136419 /ORGANISM="Unknown Unknown, Strain D1" /LENGTH=429 /DNA_ID=CAMNT_0016431309 /DNA_START=39 /DNA_END=1325 /DNA_ORIENTATION=+